MNRWINRVGRKKNDVDLNQLKQIGQKYLSTKEINTLPNQFAFFPRKLAYIHEKYQLKHKKVLDIGSGLGNFLIHFSKDSKGIELEESRYLFSRELGLNAEMKNIEKEKCSPEDKESYDVIFCSHVIEHLQAPHLFLTKLKEYLKEDGVLIIIAPVMPLNRFFNTLGKKIYNVGKEWIGQDHEHILGFSNISLLYTVQAAGYKIKENGTFLFKSRFLCAAMTFLTSLIGGQSFVIGTKDLNWNANNITY